MAAFAVVNVPPALTHQAWLPSTLDASQQAHGAVSAAILTSSWELSRLSSSSCLLSIAGVVGALRLSMPAQRRRGVHPLRASRVICRAEAGDSPLDNAMSGLGEARREKRTRSHLAGEDGEGLRDIMGAAQEADLIGEMAADPDAKWRKTEGNISKKKQDLLQKMLSAKNKGKGVSPEKPAGVQALMSSGSSFEPTMTQADIGEESALELGSRPDIETSDFEEDDEDEDEELDAILGLTPKKKPAAKADEGLVADKTAVLAGNEEEEEEEEEEEQEALIDLKAEGLPNLLEMTEVARADTIEHLTRRAFCALDAGETEEAKALFDRISRIVEAFQQLMDKPIVDAKTDDVIDKLQWDPMAMRGIPQGMGGERVVQVLMKDLHPEDFSSIFGAGNKFARQIGMA